MTVRCIQCYKPPLFNIQKSDVTDTKNKNTTVCGSYPENVQRGAFLCFNPLISHLNISTKGSPPPSRYGHELTQQHPLLIEL